jgi:hypothetical protein
MIEHWILFLVFSINGAGFVTTDKVEGFTTRAQCERMGSVAELSLPSGIHLVHFCMRVQ